LLLRSPSELSDGQRYRFRLALAFSGFREERGRVPTSALDPESRILNPFLLADEFAALLDRTLAKVIAFNLRKLVTRTGVGALLATTQEDLTDDLNPDLHVRCLGDGHVEIERRDVKKKVSRSTISFGSRKEPDPTGRTSLGGITAATPSRSSNASSCSGTAGSQSASASSAPPPRA
jgi:ABC-type glutathione transport system ATPase component